MLIRELFALKACLVLSRHEGTAERPKILLKCVSCIVKARRHGRTAIDIAKMRLLYIAKARRHAERP